MYVKNTKNCWYCVTSVKRCIVHELTSNDHKQRKENYNELKGKGKLKIIIIIIIIVIKYEIETVKK